MSGISSGIGLISGINTSQLIEQLMQIERRPLANLQARVQALTTQRTAFSQLSAQLLAIQNAMVSLGRPGFFRSFGATTTHEDVLTAEAGEAAVPGQHTFRVRSLVSNHSLISRGFADANLTPVGIGRLSIEVGGGRVNPATTLDVLNGGSGVRRGVMVITDRSGATAEVDLTASVTIDDVVNAINHDARIRVRASIAALPSGGATGDRLVIEDESGGTGNLIVADQPGGFTASDLGVVGNAAAARLDGRDLVRLSPSIPLSLLNDGNGVGRLRAGTDLILHTTYGDVNVSLTDTLATQLNTDLRMLNNGNGVRLGVIRITDKSGASAEIDLSAARTVADVEIAIDASGLGISAAVVNSHFQITDTTNATGENAEKLTIEDVSGFAAADLGLAGSVDGTAVVGRTLYRIANVGDLINAINYAPGNNSLVRASISADGKSLTLQALGLDNAVTVEAGVGSTAAADLGLAGAAFNDSTPFTSRRLITGLNTVLLRSLQGGRGVNAGSVRFVDRAGGETVIDFAGVQTLHEVIERINSEAAGSFSASINRAGTGVALQDVSGGANPQLIITDVAGTLADDLGIAVADDPVNPFVGNVVDGGSAQLQYVTRQTLLSSLNGSRGVASGDLRITDSRGAVFTVNLSPAVKTVGDVIDAINAATPDTLEVRINDTGDGIMVLDTAGGVNPLTVANVEGGRTASDLRLAASARPGQNFVDGSFEIHFDLDADDTLQEIARKLNEADAGFTASVINHSGAINPFSLTISSEVSGRRGELLVATSGVELGLATLSRAQDAVLTIGGAGAEQTLVITSPSNTVSDVVPGVKLNLLSISDNPVTIVVDRNVEPIVEAIESFVEKYNDAIETIDQSTQFNQETLQRGPLLGDSTVRQVRTRLTRLMLRPFGGTDGSLSRLFSVGLRLGEGNRLEFDRERFEEVYERSPEDVAQLFVSGESGFAAVIKESLEDLTRSFDGLISRKDEVLKDQQDLLNKRIDSLNVLLEAKRARLEAQFVGLESTLAALQDQQSALNGLAQFLA